MAKLFIVGTPIGNISDISFRALAVLKEVDLILSEDTRVIKKLLDHYQIKTPALSYHQHSRLDKSEEIASLLKKGKNLALVSDAGTPGISDPGNKLIHFLIAEKNLQIEITVVPGPSALTSAASISGFPMDKFVFLGFPPAKKKRKKFFEEATNLKYPVIFYESPYRIIKTLEELKTVLENKGKENREIFVGRELTKKFETCYRGKIAEVIGRIKKDQIRGEFVVIINQT